MNGVLPKCQLRFWWCWCYWWCTCIIWRFMPEMNETNHLTETLISVLMRGSTCNSRSRQRHHHHHRQYHLPSHVPINNITSKHNRIICLLKERTDTRNINTLYNKRWERVGSLWFSLVCTARFVNIWMALVPPAFHTHLDVLLILIVVVLHCSYNSNSLRLLAGMNVAF